MLRDAFECRDPVDEQGQNLDLPWREPELPHKFIDRSLHDFQFLGASLSPHAEALDRGFCNRDAGMP